MGSRLAVRSSLVPRADKGWVCFTAGDFGTADSGSVAPLFVGVDSPYYGQVETWNDGSGVGYPMPVVAEASSPLGTFGLLETLGAHARIAFAGGTRFERVPAWRLLLSYRGYNAAPGGTAEVTYTVDARHLPLLQPVERQFFTSPGTRSTRGRAIWFQSRLSAEFSRYGQPVDISVPPACRHV